MAISVFDLFKIGIGPSSSHTVGPMRAAHRFLEALDARDLIERTARVQTELFGSLGATGRGHGSDKAVILGLMGETPEDTDTTTVNTRVRTAREQRSLMLAGRHRIAFDDDSDLVLYREKSLPFHSNGMRLRALDASGAVLHEAVYYSVGGGFVVDESAVAGDDPLTEDQTTLPYPFTTAEELLCLANEHNVPISSIMFANERVWHSDEDIRAGLLRIWDVMQGCVQQGMTTEGVLPGGMKVKRRAFALHRKLTCEAPGEALPIGVLDWVNLYALAVNEENAGGGRVVTAPTNGAAGIIPAVMHYYAKHCPGATEDGIIRFLLTAGAIGILFKENASISGAEVGCQGEVGSACSMAAGALTEVLGGTPAQVENAAEIGMEHNLGLTCDPIGGLVQVPCIERNAMASVKAINASRMALRGDGTHFVSLDKVIKTMRETGMDMSQKYKETARGGLAIHVLEVPVNVVEC
ncbi:MAG: L-serine ammonia-lyase [Pseudomonadota bacterium]